MSLDASTASPASSLLSIDGVTASQIIGSAAPQPLSSGRLDLLPAPAAASGGDDDSAEPLLVVQVAESVFPLYKDTVMGTHDGKEEWYTFSLPLKHDNALQAETSAQEQQTWVRLVLPPLTTPALVSLRDRFEEHLIARGLLYDGLRAAGDEVGRGAGQSGAEHARAIHQNAAAHQTTTDPTDTPWKFSRWSHSLSQGFKGSSGTVSEYTTAASNAVSGLAASAGAAAGSVYQKARDQLTTETADEKQERERYEKQLDDGQAGGEDSRIMPNTRDAMYDAFQGAGQGLSDVTSATTKEAPSIVAHNVGEEASKIASDAGQGLQNVGKATADVTIGTSTVYHGVEAAKGAVQSSGK